MIIKRISLGKRAQRYLFTYLIGNHLVGFFLSLALHQGNEISFWALLLMVLTISHVTATVCLVATDIFEMSVERFLKISLPFHILCLTPTIVVLVPGLYAGFSASNALADLLGIAWNPPFHQILSKGLLFGAIVSVFHMMYASWLYQVQRKFEQEKALAIAENRLLQAKLDLLSKELNPHLLFNLIQSVLYLLRSDVDRAEKMLENISVYYQMVLLSFNKQSIALEDEISLNRQYVALNGERFANLTLVIDDHEVKKFASFLIPPMLLQPLVENALKHGFARMPSESPKHLSIAMSLENARLRIEVSNNGEGSKLQKQASQGFLLGLQNCEARMKKFYGTSAELKLEMKPQGACVRLDLPYDSH